MTRVQQQVVRSVLLAGFCVLLPQSAFPQWQQQSNTNNIFNTNTGSIYVGNGTYASPSQKLTLGLGNILLPAANLANDGNLFFGGVTVNGQVGMRLYGGLVNGSLPAAFVDVMTTDSNDGLRIRVDTSVGGTERMRITGGGNVGIGTSSPAYKLDVAGSIKAVSTGDALPTAGGFVIFNTAAGGDGNEYFYIWRSLNPAAVQMQAGNNSSYKNMLLNPNAGTVAIGTTAPDTTVKLHVNGAVRVDGNIAAKYQDFAEWVRGRGQLKAGTVVILDSDRSNAVTPSQSAYDQRVAGVISKSPGVVLGESGPGKAIVATAGRVKVRADASGSAIRIGDLLVTSDREGYAMRSQPIDVGGVSLHRPGTVLGKALEPLETGTGEILVLLALQ